MKTIRTFENVVDAEMARQVLENEGVRAYIHTYTVCRAMGSMLSVAVGGVRLAVDDADVEKAVKILTKE